MTDLVCIYFLTLANANFLHQKKSCLLLSPIKYLIGNTDANTTSPQSSSLVLSFNCVSASKHRDCLRDSKSYLLTPHHQLTGKDFTGYRPCMPSQGTVFFRIPFLFLHLYAFVRIHPNCRMVCVPDHSWTFWLFWVAFFFAESQFYSFKFLDPHYHLRVVSHLIGQVCMHVLDPESEESKDNPHL